MVGVVVGGGGSGNDGVGLGNSGGGFVVLGGVGSCCATQYTKAILTE